MYEKYEYLILSQHFDLWVWRVEIKIFSHKKLLLPGTNAFAVELKNCRCVCVCVCVCV